MARLSGYRQRNLRRSLWELLITAIPFALVWSATLTAALKLEQFWLYALLIVPAAGLLVRLFMIQHDCGHGSFFRNRSGNDWTGRVIGAGVMAPDPAPLTLVARERGPSEDYVVATSGITLGLVGRTCGMDNSRWYWNFSAVYDPERGGSKFGGGATNDEALAGFKDAWQAWLALAALGRMCPKSRLTKGSGLCG